MGYAALVKCALVAAVAWFIWHMAASIHDNIYNDGRIAERVEWQEKRAREISELNAEREKQVSGLTGALDYANKAKDSLSRQLDDVRAANRGLWISAKECGNETARKAEDTGIGGGGPERIRLPGEIEQNLWELVSDAQQVVIQYEQCRKTLLPLVELE